MLLGCDSAGDSGTDNVAVVAEDLVTFFYQAP